MSKLRFKDEMGNDYPDWKTLPLSKIATKIINGSKPKIYKGNIPIVGSGGIFGNTSFTKTNNNSIGLPRKGSMKIWFFNEPVWNTDTIFLIEKVSKEVYLFFLYCHLLNKNWKKIITGGNRPSINKSDWEKLKFNLPIKSEQQKIGNTLSYIDELIENKVNEINKLENYKKGLMQRLFAVNKETWLRFKDEKGNDYLEWDENPLLNLFSKKSSSLTIKKVFSQKSLLNCYPVFTANQNIYFSNCFQTNIEGLSLLKDGAGAGRIQRIPKYSSVLGTMMILTTNKIDHNFSFYLLSRINFDKYITGTTIPHIYFKDISKEKLQIPNEIIEQQKIGNTLSYLDELIENEQQQKEQLNLYKKGLMQQLF